MKALYRKYRPKCLAEVVGQEQVTGPLGNSLKAGKVSHAYLFTGPRGTGKTSVARIFAHEVNGFEYNLEDDYVDIIEIDGASNRGIDNIRELREKVMIAPTAGKYKVYIIDEVHMLTKDAFNALLKTLEEPPESVIFIMATTDAYKVPVTITSRAQTYTFKLADPAVMLGHLKAIAEKEGIKITDDALEIVVKRGGGSFRDSLSLLDQISTLSAEEITKELVIGAMGLPDDEKILNLLNSYTGGDVVKITTVLKDLLSGGIKPETIAEEMITQIIAAPRPELMPLLAKLPDIKEPFAEARLLVALTTGMIANTQTMPAAQPARARLAPQPNATLRQESAPQSIATQPQETKPITEKLQPKSAQSVTSSTSSAPQPPSGPFSWDEFLQNVLSVNDAIHSQLVRAGYQVSGDVLTIFPEKKINKTILSRENNKKILIDAAGGWKITIADPGDNPNLKNDPLLSKISGIMGGEVRNDTGGNPF
ncbi:DNA polymerase III subunit gamma/tau [Candidatus Saccharibacteria bacterium]|nr:DNA polymerase III subunit gamma/tau [Candidatus Saccharibacteria bacterium]